MLIVKGFIKYDGFDFEVFLVQKSKITTYFKGFH